MTADPAARAMLMSISRSAPLLIALALVFASCSSDSGDSNDGPDRDATSDAGTDSRGERPDDDTSASDAASEDEGPFVPDVIARPDLPRRETGPTVNQECAQVTAVGDPVFAPVDIIWAIDTSGSMNEETIIVQEQLNRFVEFIEASGLDVRVVMIASSAVCIPAPLSGGGCPDSDSDRYRHVRVNVESSDAMRHIIGSYDRYRDFLRPDAITHFVVVSDDESDRDENWFRDEAARVGIRFFTYHAIVSLEETVQCPLGPAGPCIPGGCVGPHGTADRLGARHMRLARLTGGTVSSICEPEWDPIFDAIATNVLAGAVLPCLYAIPDLGGGLEIAYDQVDVTLNGSLLRRHTTPAGCEVAPGWYYNDTDPPTEVIICPSLCGSGFDGDAMAIEFGCVKS